MKKFCIEKILNVVTWNDTLFSFFSTKNKKLRFINGQFVTIGLNDNKKNKLIIRAYSIVSPNYYNHLEFLSIILEKGKFTTLLKNINIGDYIIISSKSNGTLLMDNIKTGKILYLLASGTGIAPFISLVLDPILYKRFNKIILIHGVSYINDLSYKHIFYKKIIYNNYINTKIKQKLFYYPTITRENYITKGRITELFIEGKLFKDLKLPFIKINHDNLMLCGNKNMIQDIREYLKHLGLKQSLLNNTQDFVIEYSFVCNKTVNKK